ncbi:uncharacterized protein B0I36DRAFT_155084 [Microdochium trichocladiopsis]|uniref:ZZ-type domain-containing protein n=1 Tax=Microdochium trichocladiopsis TaxID=1682393 RepID=A0A9P8Y0D1_9PEZI|nr:uncharacterized protein B0I36DRAFT_155084 [Microdochium trichocladiopsis]KAH7026195.1 hypothetical protein B0I36DRAFT_155084 [Microdochium trichocladiopsis]
MAAAPTTTSLDTLITLKVNHNGSAKRFKLPLRDLTMVSLEDKIRDFLQIAPDTSALIERYSDSAAAFVTVERDNIQVYKQLFRAAKAKHKLKLRVTTPQSSPSSVIPQPATVEDDVDGEHSAHSEPQLVSPSTSTLAMAEPAALVLTTEAPSQVSLTSEASQETLQETAVPYLPAFTFSKRPFTVCCNKCDKAVPDAHFHCSKCDDGDFDLCQECVNSGITCNDDSHWLIKRTIKDGEITQSTTARILTTKKVPVAAPAAVPTAAVPSIMDLPIRPLEAATCRVSSAPTWSTAYNARTCNSCVQEFPEQNFVHCNTCDDFDLCKACFVTDQHGHHPKHTFSAAVKGTAFDQAVSTRLAAGRNVLHNAICDGCERYVRGVRHKCLDCPDWDYCSECVQSAALIHPNHRFVPLYEALIHPATRQSQSATHYGIRCDGPLCTANGGTTHYIVGDRYKCAVCHDTDFCANCEASPANEHNKTHPLIKFRTPVRHVSVTTLGEHEDGQRLPPMGDRRSRRQPMVPAAAPATSTRDSIAASPVQTVVDVKPTESAPVEAPKVEQLIASTAKDEPAGDASLVATFQRDTVADGTTFPPNHIFEQTWTLRNEGSTAWPAGCAVKFVGGDYMGAIDPHHPAGLNELVSASESNVVPTTVAPGQEISFSVMLRTPDREGKVISYWRLTTSDGHKFGHKLWCDVVVKKPAEVQADEAVRSQMIIPKLEHESPSASIIQDNRAETETQTETATETASLPALDRAEEDFEDCADADNWANDSDDGFMTDEEYDILDASDEEYLTEQHRSASSRK